MDTAAVNRPGVAPALSYREEDKRGGECVSYPLHGGNCARYLALSSIYRLPVVLLFLPGRRPSLRYSITADGFTSQSWPGFIPLISPCLSSLAIWDAESPDSFDACATVMYSSSGKQPSRSTHG